MSLPPQQENFWPQQSPIDLFKRDCYYVKVPQSYFQWKYRDAPYFGSFEGEEGHRNFVLKLEKWQRPPMIRLNGEKAKLVKVHLHMPSEHDVDGKDRTGEIHLIHEIVAPQRGSELIVLGIFFEESSQSEKIAFATQGNAISLDPNHLMPCTKKWYRYEGSLTSEPYTEFVSWLVFEDALQVSSTDLELIQKYADQPSRSTQPVNRRFVLRNFR